MGPGVHAGAGRASPLHGNRTSAFVFVVCVTPGRSFRRPKREIGPARTARCILSARARAFDVKAVTGAVFPLPSAPHEGSERGRQHFLYFLPLPHGHVPKHPRSGRGGREQLDRHDSLTRFWPAFHCSRHVASSSMTARSIARYTWSNENTSKMTALPMRDAGLSRRAWGEPSGHKRHAQDPFAEEEGPDARAARCTVDVSGPAKCARPCTRRMRSSGLLARHVAC